ncbi:MAG: hypothetical protein KatS3mg106_460 [Gemmataceae bacterium]|jgi:hypothetical protein|nr:MAG: hypothetical protein KatS3mg106_460 [Gemmataceae bacterium]
MKIFFSRSSRYAALYLKADAGFQVFDLLSRFASTANISLVDPRTGLVDVIDETGETIPLSVTEFETRIRRNDEKMTFQIWWNPFDYSDLIISVKPILAAVKIRLYMGNQSDNQMQKIADTLKSIFVPLAREKAVWALIIDQLGISAENPRWDEIVIGRVKLQFPFPQELWLPVDSPCLESVDKRLCRVTRPDPAVVRLCYLYLDLPDGSGVYLVEWDNI